MTQLCQSKAMMVSCILHEMQFPHSSCMASFILHLSAMHTEEYKHAFGGPSSSSKQATLTGCFTSVQLSTLPHHKAGNQKFCGERSLSAECCSFEQFQAAAEWP